MDKEQYYLQEIMRLHQIVAELSSYIESQQQSNAEEEPKTEKDQE